MEFLEHFDWFFIELVRISNFIHESNDVVKAFLIGVLLMTYWRVLSNGLTRLFSWVGKRFFTSPYFNSFFENRKMVKILLIILPIMLLNVILPEIGWTFDANKVAMKLQIKHGTNGLGQSLASNLWGNGSSANISPSRIAQSVPIYKEGRLISNLLYLSNFIVFIYWLSNFLNHTVKYLSAQEKYSKKPLHGFAQIIYIVSLVVIIATVYAHYTEQSPITLFTTLSVMSVAVFMTLKDIIMGIISTFIIMGTDLIKVGDWITNSRYNANGHVTEISLTTVKVLNFDKTVSNIPTYSFISEGFQNQQEMINSGLRRLKQQVRIDPTTIRFLTYDELMKYRCIENLGEYIDKRLTSVRKMNNKNLDYNISLNGKQFTNLDLYRKYIEMYLKENSFVFMPHERAEKDKHIMLQKRNINDTEPIVHIIEGNKEGVGLEVYCFLKNAEKFQVYESHATSVMTKMYASAPLFGLKINC